MTKQALKRSGVFALGIGVGISLTVMFHNLSASAGGDGRGGAVKENGDIDGNGAVELTDAITLLTFLFLGGAPPAKIDCEPAQTGPVHFRLFNDLACNGVGFSARLDFCDGFVEDLTDDFESACTVAQGSPVCQSTVSATTDCGVFSLCTDLAVEDGKVYDHVLTLDANNFIIVLLFIQNVDVDGNCPAFPAPGAAPQRIYSAVCFPGGGAAAVSGGVWSAGKYKQ